ncbi:DNA polymerase epsilon catalytic subunit A [Arachis hypogaea]|nr:DNA polymerase epsilon catalytic subunit A [Arachis hypogaea]
MNDVPEQMNGTTGRTNVSSYFRTNEVALKQYHWQIIQLLQSSQIGQFFAWVVVDGIMLRFLFRFLESFTSTQITSY